MRLDNQVADGSQPAGELLPRDPAALAIEQERHGGDTVVTLRGELDISSSPHFGASIRELVADGSGAVIIDLSELSFIDSSGLHVLLDTQRRLTRRGRALTVRCTPGVVLRAIELVRLSDTLGVVTPSG